MTMHDDINISDDYAFSTFALRAFSEAFPPMTEQYYPLPLHLRAQPVCHLSDLVDVRDHHIVADEVPVDDDDGGWKEMRAALA